MLRKAHARFLGGWARATAPGYPTQPHAFTLGRRRIAILEILDRWLAPDHRYFKVRVEDGRSFVLRHDNQSGAWEIAGLVGPERSAGAGSGVLH